MPIMEIDQDVYGNIMDAGGTQQIGKFKSLLETDRWKWFAGQTWFPSTFKFDIQSNGGVGSPSFILPAYSFSQTRVTPTQQWTGSTIYTIEKNGTLIGWLEAWNDGSDAKLMWWSNGNSVNANGRISASAGDELLFQTGTLPKSKEFPLEHQQIST